MARSPVPETERSNPVLEQPVQQPVLQQEQEQLVHDDTYDLCVDVYLYKSKSAEQTLLERGVAVDSVECREAAMETLTDELF